MQNPSALTGCGGSFLASTTLLTCAVAVGYNIRMSQPAHKKFGIVKNEMVPLDGLSPDFKLTSPSRMFGTHTNLVPMYNNTSGTRTFYGGKYENQIVPLSQRETPWVQALDPESKDGKSFEEMMGADLGARFYMNEEDGEVIGVTPDEIQYRTPSGKIDSIELYNNFPLNRKTQLSNTPVVKVGDKLKNGGIVAKSNYTDDAGTMSMGINARVAMVAYKGHSMDDAIVVSEGFAKRMTSEQNYQHDLAKDKDVITGKKHFSSVFPTTFTSSQLDTLDDQGMAKPGTILHKGDPIMLATKPRRITGGAHMGSLKKMFKTARTDASIVWEHDYPGEVTDTIDKKGNSKVLVKAFAPLEVGDKIIAGRNGQKDIVSKIIPDKDMLRDKDGNPFEVLLNPLALPSRINTATLYEMQLGKVAAKLGKPIKVPGFTKRGESRLAFVRDMLAQNGLSDTEKVYDPEMGIWLETPVSTGINYMYKLHHMVDSKMSARGNGAYDQNQQPMKGGTEAGQAKRIGGLENTALLARGAYQFLRENATLRGQQNDEYWRLIRQNYNPPRPEEPFVWHKFQALLNGAGYNAKDLGKGRLRLQPLLDKDLAERRPMEIQNGKMVDPDTLESKEGGLFDSRLISGDRWGYIKLPHALPNPAMEGNIQKILGITAAQMRDVLAGRLDLDEARGIKK